MRFIYFDKVLELEKDKRALAHKVVSLTEEFLPAHYGKVAVMPPSLVVECLAQVAGWLHVASRDFQVETMLVLLEDVEFLGLVQPGHTLILEAWLSFGHIDGATMRAEARIGDQPIARVGRMLFGSKVIPDPRRVQDRRDGFSYRGGNLKDLERP
jgi:3-hydroxymyristoyl/3-hydroxydecanoyl-(acyl carrier protein) dehydratase